MKLFSGIQPTGLIHIGNYFGAIKNWVNLQNKYSSLFCIVDYHAITVSYQPNELQEKINNLAIDLIACGIDPEKSILFVQSMVPEHTELAWLLNTITPLGDLQRMTQFKEKSQKNPKNVNAGLFNYPVLMAADILLYQAEKVPVGDDQVQHLELAREIARRFNKKFGKTFPEPKPILTSGSRIMALDNPENKMSKSGGQENYISISDSPEIIREKLSKAVTDPARQRKTDPGTPEKCNLYHIHKLVSNKKDLDYVDQGCRQAKIGCLDCKKLLAQNLIDELEPIQKNIKKLKENPEKIEKILKNGGQKAQKMAQKTLKEVKKKMGLL